MTIEQQLKDFAANPIAGGVRWEKEPTTPRTHHLAEWFYKINIYETICIFVHRDGSFTFGCMCFAGKTLKSRTIREACEEAISLVKARAKEIYEALGGIIAPEINPSDIRAFLLVNALRYLGHEMMGNFAQDLLERIPEKERMKVISRLPSPHKTEN